MGTLKDIWDEISFEKKFPNEPNARLKSWFLYTSLLARQKIRAKDSDNCIYVATGDKASQLLVKYKLQILDQKGFDSR